MSKVLFRFAVIVLMMGAVTLTTSTAEAIYTPNGNRVTTICDVYGVIGTLETTSPQDVDEDKAATRHTTIPNTMKLTFTPLDSKQAEIGEQEAVCYSASESLSNIPPLEPPRFTPLW